MYVSPFIRFPEDRSQSMPAPRRARFGPILTLVLVGLLTVGGVLLLSYGGLTPACGDAFGTECVLGVG